MSEFEDLWDHYWLEMAGPIFCTLRDGHHGMPQIARKIVEQNSFDGKENNTVVEYYIDNILIATKTVMGGAQEAILITKEGKDIYFQCLIARLTKAWKENG